VAAYKAASNWASLAIVVAGEPLPLERANQERFLDEYCGLQAVRVTSLQKEIGAQVSLRWCNSRLIFESRGGKMFDGSGGGKQGEKVPVRRKLK
jgi:hypothetical protein